MKHTKKAKGVEMPKPGNPIAVAHQKTGGSKSGAHKNKAKEIPRKTKHKSKPVEGWTHDSLAAELFEQDHTYEDRLTRMLEGKLAFMEADDIQQGYNMMPTEEFDGGGEYNDEVGMIRNDLHTLVRCAEQLDEILTKNENVAEWAQEKIAVAKSMMVTILDYVQSEHELGHTYRNK